MVALRTQSRSGGLQAEADGALQAEADDLVEVGADDWLGVPRGVQRTIHVEQQLAEGGPLHVQVRCDELPDVGTVDGRFLDVQPVGQSAPEPVGDDEFPGGGQHGHALKRKFMSCS